MRLWATTVIAVVGSSTLVSGASPIELTIVPGVGIGKVELGMTLRQAERVLGSDDLVNVRSTIAGDHYVEYGWDFSTWSVGFLQSGHMLRAVNVATTLSGQRSPGGLGVGSRLSVVARAYLDAKCARFHAFGSTDPYNTWVGLYVPSKPGTETVFLVEPVDKSQWAGVHPWRVYEVVVRQQLPGVARGKPCDAGWQERGTPYRP